MERWVEIRKAGNFVEMGQLLGVSPVVARILRNRDIVDKKQGMDFLCPGDMKLHDGALLKDIDKAAEIIKEKINSKKSIRIIGDYDVDGISATYILYRGLTFFGALTDYRIPHRIEDGYGINIKMIDEAVEAGIDTIITCDNGISALEQTKHAGELGLTMVITDHHEVPYEEIDGEKHYLIPEAAAVIDPKRNDDDYPFKGICGAFVAFKFIEVLAGKMGVKDSDEFSLLVRELTEFAALATVCDVMELKDENRSLVYRGMKYMSLSHNLGMRSLIEATGLKGKALTVYHLGFVIGPCLNASGRLDTSLKALELFLETDRAAAMARALELKDLNESRKLMTLNETAKAEAIVDALPNIPKVIVVLLEDCHESLAGIIAGRLKEKYSRPSIVITRTDKGLKGSGRSIDAYDMFEELTKVKDLLAKYGGHKMAAGLSLSGECFDEFNKRLNEECSLKEEDCIETVRIDMELPFSYIDLRLCEELEGLEPFGTGNARPLFARRNVTLISGREMGKNRKAARYKFLDDTGKVIEAVYFGDLETFDEFVRSKFGAEEADNLYSGMRVNINLDVVYELSVNEFRGSRSPQIQIKYYRA